MKSLLCVLLTAAILMCVAGPLLADGTITAPPPTVVSWRIADLRFPLISGRAAVVGVAYLRVDGSLDRIVEHTINGEDYDAFLVALNTPVGPEEATIYKLYEDGTPVLDGEGNPVHDSTSVLNYRLSKWLVLHGKVPGAQADPVSINRIPVPLPPPTEEPAP